MDIPPPILENFYNQGGDDDGDDHEHEDKEGPYTLWRLATSDGSPFLSVYSPLLMLLLRKQVLSPMVALRTYSNTRCMVFGINAEVIFDDLRGHRRLKGRAGGHDEAAKTEGLPQGQGSSGDDISLRIRRAINPLGDGTSELSMKAPMSVSKPADLG